MEPKIVLPETKKGSTWNQKVLSYGDSRKTLLEKIWHGSSDPQKVQQLQNREHCWITAWYGNCSASDRKALQKVVRTAQYITGAKLPGSPIQYTH